MLCQLGLVMAGLKLYEKFVSLTDVIDSLLFGIFS